MQAPSAVQTDYGTLLHSYSHIFYYTLHGHSFSGVSLLVQDSEIAESQGIASPKQDDTAARVSDHLQAPQDARRRASTGSSPISETGSTGTLDSVGQLGFSQQSVQSNGMRSYFLNLKNVTKCGSLAAELVTVLLNEAVNTCNYF